jgi:hypothetical protein
VQWCNLQFVITVALTHTLSLSGLSRRRRERYGLS